MHEHMYEHMCVGIILHVTFSQYISFVKWYVLTNGKYMQLYTTFKDQGIF